MGKLLIGNVKGPKGDQGDRGEQGVQGPMGPQGPTGEVDANTQILYEVPETYQPPESGLAIKTLFGRITKGLSDLFSAIGVLSELKTVEKETLVAAINELADGKLDVTKIIASTNITQPGYVMDGKTTADALTALSSNMLKISITTGTNFTSMKHYINETDYYEYIFSSAEIVYRKNVDGTETVIWRK